MSGFARTVGQLRDLRVSVAGYTPRTEIFEGEPHLVVPVVALVEGVVHAMNAALPEFVSSREFSKQPAGWNGRPIFEGHPLVNGRAVSGNSPEVLASKKIGTVFNASAPEGKLAMEAWLHIKRCQRIAPTMLARARAGEPIEISIGTFVDTDDVVGEHNGKAYRGAWKDLTPDHLALLPEGTPGACSREMGCGVRYAQDARMLDDDYRVGIGNGNNQYTQANAAAEKATSRANALNAKAMNPAAHVEAAHAHEAAASAHTRALVYASKDKTTHHEGRTDAHNTLAAAHREAANGKYGKSEFPKGMTVLAENTLREARDISQATRDNLDASDFAGPNESFPIKLPVDVGNAARALGRAKGDRAAIKRRIVAIAYKKGPDFVAQLPDDWRRKVDAQRNASLFARMMTAARAAFRPAQNADEMSDVDLKRDLLEALQEVEDRVNYVEAYHPVTDPTHVVYCVTEAPDADDAAMTGECCGPLEQTWYERPFTLSPAGTITLGDARVEVEPVMRYEPVEGAAPEADEPTDLQKRKSRNAAAGAPGSSGNDAHDNNDQETDMQKNEVLKALEGATDCQLAAIGTILKPRSEAEIRAAVAKEAADKDAADKAQAEVIRVEVAKALEAAKPKDFAAVLAQAPADVKAQFKAATDAVAARKVAALKSLEGKDTGFSKEELDAKDGAELEKIAKLAGVRAAVDYGAQGVNGVGAVNTTEAPAPPDLGASIRAARAAKK